MYKKFKSEKELNKCKNILPVQYIREGKKNNNI